MQGINSKCISSLLQGIRNGQLCAIQINANQNYRMDVTLHWFYLSASMEIKHFSALPTNTLNAQQNRMGGKCPAGVLDEGLALLLLWSYEILQDMQTQLSGELKGHWYLDKDYITPTFLLHSLDLSRFFSHNWEWKKKKTPQSLLIKIWRNNQGRREENFLMFNSKGYTK